MLAAYDVTLEEYGGDVQAVPISALKVRWISMVHGEWWPRNFGIMGSNPTRVTTMIPHMTPVLVGSRKRTRDLLKLVMRTCFTIELN